MEENIVAQLGEISEEKKIEALRRYIEQGGDLTWLVRLAEIPLEERQAYIEALIKFLGKIVERHYKLLESLKDRAKTLNEDDNFFLNLANMTSFLINEIKRYQRFVKRGFRDRLDRVVDPVFLMVPSRVANSKAGRVSGVYRRQLIARYRSNVRGLTAELANMTLYEFDVLISRLEALRVTAISTRQAEERYFNKGSGENKIVDAEIVTAEWRGKRKIIRDVTLYLIAVAMGEKPSGEPLDFQNSSLQEVLDEGYNQQLKIRVSAAVDGTAVLTADATRRVNLDTFMITLLEVLFSFLKELNRLLILFDGTKLWLYLLWDELIRMDSFRASDVAKILEGLRNRLELEQDDSKQN